MQRLHKAVMAAVSTTMKEAMLRQSLRMLCPETCAEALCPEVLVAFEALYYAGGQSSGRRLSASR